ncbi:MAG: Ig-like domain repeat protein [Methanobacteriaceae archaeon]|nr:Ig-like domain repeat protein [Methanobacteriaceae archaeon]
MLQISANPGTIHYLDTSNIIADLTWNTYDGVNPNVQPVGGHIPDKIPVTFATDLGNIDPEDTETTSGTADSTFTGTEIGTATVSAQVDNEVQTTQVEVQKADTDITVDPATGVYLGSTTLSATLLDEHGNPVDGVQVDFFVDGAWIGSATTDGSGYAEVSYNPITVNPADNPHTIRVEFAGNDYYNPSFGTNELNVEKANTVINVDPAAGVYLGGTTLSATLLDEHGNPVDGVQVDFFVDGAWIGSATTDGSGYAEVSYNPITVNPADNPHTIRVEFAGNDYYNPSFGTNELNVDKATTNVTVDDVIGNKGKTVNLNATLKDQYGNLLAGRTINFLVNGINAGSAITDVNGVATKSYNINLNGGMYTIQADFVGDDYYQASCGTGKLKVPQADLYIKSWASKKNPYVGETITITFKLGNRGPDTAENVVFTIKIPEGMKYVGSNVDVGTIVYDPKTRTLTWTIGDVPVGDPYLYLRVKVLKAGRYVFKPQITTDTYDPNIDENIEILVINAKSKHHSGHKVPMQKTGVPIWSLILAVLLVCAGLIKPFKK